MKDPPVERILIISIDEERLLLTTRGWRREMGNFHSTIVIEWISRGLI